MFWACKPLQLRSTYGRDEAQTLIANTSVKCILRAGDAENVKSMEHELGDQEIERVQVNDSFSQERSRPKSKSKHIYASGSPVGGIGPEVMGLPDLHGFLKIPGDEIARIEVEYAGMPNVNC